MNKREIIRDKILISELEIIPVRPQNGLIAFASCVLNNQFYLGNIAIYTSPSSLDGFRLAYPTKILPTGKEIHCFHPITKASGEKMHNAIVDKFKELMDNVKLKM